MHADSYCTGAYPWEGPLGVNPQVDSLSMGLIGGLVATVAVDSRSESGSPSHGQAFILHFTRTIRLAFLRETERGRV